MIFLIFGMIQPRIEPRCPFANTLGRLTCSDRYIVSWPTVVEGDTTALISVATTLRD